MIKILITFLLFIGLGGCIANDKKSLISNKAYDLSDEKYNSVDYNKSKINPNKFVWKTMVQRVRKENLSIIRCLGKLKNYKF